MFSISRFEAVMKGVSRGAFDRLVREHAADKYSKKFGSWSQLVAMIYAQLSGASSLRTVALGFNMQGGQHFHLGTQAIHRSTLADANARRTPALFEAVARQLMAQAQRGVRRQAQEGLHLLDSTSITLTGPGFDDWTWAHRNPRTQGVKLHVLYATDTQTPLTQRITAANVNDIEEGVTLPITPGAIYVFDKGYCHYGWWAQIDAAGAQFVTRFKANAGLRLVQARNVTAADSDSILADDLVRFAHPHTGKRRHAYTEPLRRVTVARPGKATPLVLATNDLDSPASVIAQRYKERWQVELFFKWIKQHLKIKRFFGRSENAVRIQILCALIAHLLLALYHAAHGSALSRWHFFSELCATLFQRPQTDQAYRRRRHERLAEMAQRQARLFA